MSSPRRSGATLRILAVSASQIYTLATATVVLILTTRWLGPEGRGIVASITTLVTMLGTLAGLSLGHVAVYRASRQPMAEQLPALFGTLLGAAAIGGFAIWAGVLLTIAFGVGSALQVPGPLLAIGLTAVPFLIADQYCSVLMLLLDRSGTYARIHMTIRTLQLAALVIAWGAGAGLGTVVLVGAVVQMGLALGPGLVLWRHCATRPRFDWPLLKGLASEGVRLHGAHVGDLFITNTSVVVVNAWLGPAATGVYHTALALVAVPMVVPQAAAMVMLGRIGDAGPVAAWQEQRRQLVVLLGLAAAAIVSCWTLAPVVVPLVIGDRFAPTIGLLQWLSLILLSTTVVRVMNPQWLGRGYFGAISATTALMGAVNLTGLALLLPRYGTHGAALSLLAAHAAGFGIQIWMILRCERELAAWRRTAA